MEYEFSERGRYVTEQVKLWIANDGKHSERVRTFIREEGSVHAMGDYLVRVIKSAEPHTAPWQVAQELSANDYGRINWADVAHELSD